MLSAGDTQATTDAVVAAATRLLNSGGVAGVSAESICAAAHVTTAAFDDNYSSVGAVFADLVRRLMAEHGARMGQSVSRHRSLTAFLARVNLVFLDVLEEFPDEHQALMCLRVAEIGSPALIAHRGPERSIHETLTTNCELWLGEVERIQDMSWELPIGELASIQVAATYGLVLDYLSRRDRPAAERSIQIGAYFLAGYGRRRHKNGPS